MNKIREPRLFQMRRNNCLNRFKGLIRYDKTGGLLRKAPFIKFCRLVLLRMQLGKDQIPVAILRQAASGEGSVLFQKAHNL